MTPQEEIKEILDRMFHAWNTEDLVGWLAPYSRSEDMRWSMKGRWYKGWSSMEREYSRGYPPGAMGIIAMTDLEIQIVEPAVAIALYHWTHTLPTQQIAGSTTQVFHEIDGRWQCIHENSARVPAP